MIARFVDLERIDVEHLLSSTSYEGIVKVRCTGKDGLIMLGQVTPAAARDIAAHLFEAAARAEYEQDFWAGSKAFGVPEESEVAS